jgi:hypothetical protein
MRASKRLGHQPPTLSREWLEETKKMNTSKPLESDPEVGVFLNPHYHSVPPSGAMRAVVHED